MKNKDYVKNFDSFVDSLLENRDIKKGTDQFDRIKKNVLSFKELFEQSVDDLPKGSKKDLEDLVDLAVEKDKKEVKDAAKDPSFAVTPWDAITDWMSAEGNPTKWTRGGKLEELPEAWQNKFKNRKPTIDRNTMIKCMEYWNGKMGKALGKEKNAIDYLEKLADPAFIKKIIDVSWKKADGYPKEGTKINLWGDDFTYPKDITFDKKIIEEKAKILLEKAKEIFDQSGKLVRVKNLGITDNDKECLGLFPKTSFNLEMTPEQKSKYEEKGRDAYENAISTYARKQTSNFWMWYSIISNEDKFKKLLARLEDPKYIQTTFLKITDADKINIIKGIYSEAQEKFAKTKSISPLEGIYGASCIKWWPKKAVESMPKEVIQSEGGGQTPEVEKIWDFAWPYAQKDGENLAMTYFKNDSATIEDGRDKDVDNAVKEIMDKIKSDKGELLKLTYRIVASTSDEPSKYQQNGVIGGEWLPKNNEYLVVARAKTIENALNKAITTYSIPKEKVIKDDEVLRANNTLGGTAVYEKMKSMRSGTEQQKADYKKLFAQPKHSGILFNIEYLTKDSGETPPDEEVVQPYSVSGEWVYEIKWSGMGSSRKRRRTRSRKPIKGINWGKLFPDIPAGGGGSSVRDLCAAYG
jgi:hypothetical protein